MYDAMLMVSGKSQIDGSDSLKIVVDDVFPVSKATSRFAKVVKIVASRQRTKPEHIQKARDLMNAHPGKMEVIFSVFDENAEDRTKPSAMYRAKDFRFSADDAAIEGLMRLFGHKQVKFWSE